eukprot:TRINITY_DN278_c0_g1_i1.p2 TRINITY_DN278_c0_g1~~TRINITY_DN278_c0_g1_i1.p2  ORF type:complete len:274 (-),score=65.00 TRINITY_DN278_c0_g1_i1:383-1204(-)
MLCARLQNSFFANKQALPASGCQIVVQRNQKVSSKIECRRTKIVRNAMSMEKEDKMMKDAETRWENQIREGKVKNVSCSEIPKMMQEGWVLLDVRPSTETKKASIVGAVKVPLFIPDTGMSPGSLLKQMSAFGMGGWWLGGTHMEPNDSFMADVQARLPRDAKVIVVCQKGLRSLAACEKMSMAGYETLAWVNGGFDTAETEVPLPVEGKETDIRYAGIGGLSAVLGWTEVQQQENKSFGDIFENVIKLAVLVLVLDLAVFGWEQFKFLTGQS